MLDELLGSLTDHGIQCLGHTPLLSDEEYVRPLEILDWLRHYNEHADSEPVSGYVAIDDLVEAVPDPVA